MNKFFVFIILFLSIHSPANNTSKIIFPYESSVLLPNYTYEILWQNDEIGAIKVKIELFQDGNFFQIITQETENNGKFLWTVPKNLHSGIPNPYNYSIKIVDLLHSNNFTESDLFIISAQDFIYPFIIIPVASHNRGAYNSYWKSDLFFYNGFYLEDTIDIYMFLFKEGKLENESPIGYYFKMQKGDIKIIEDVVKSAFRTNGAGSIIIDEYYMHQIYWVIPATAFLYNDMGENHIYGAHIPAMGNNASDYDSTNNLLLGLKENKDFRTNIGIASKADFTIDLKIILYDDNANLIGEKEIILPPFGFHQEYNIYRQFTSEEINGGFAFVEILNYDFRPFVYPFASVVNNGTGSFYFIPQF